MTDAEIRRIESAAREHLNRCRTLEARITGGKGGPSVTNAGLVPVLCESILKLAAELRSRGRAP